MPKRVELIDPNLVERICSEVSGMERTREGMDEFVDQLTTYWEATHDESLYEKPGWTWAAYYCWAQWTQPTMKKLEKLFQWYGEPKTFVDLGAGIGVTTAYLLQRWPNSFGTYNNLPCPQVEVAVRLFFELDLIERVDIKYEYEYEELTEYEVVFALELLEHIHDPIGFVLPWLDHATMFIDGSSFTAPGYGHLTSFVGGTPPEKMRSLLNKELRRLGFVNAKKIGGPSMWNNRPAVWVRPELMKVR